MKSVIALMALGVVAVVLVVVIGMSGTITQNF
jgi:hypothetical protein